MSTIVAISIEFLEKLDNKRSPSHVTALLLILLIGYALRLYSLNAGQGYHYFAINDQLDAFDVVLRFLAGETRAYYIGQPYFAGGSAPGPAWTLFCVLLYKLGNNTMAGTLFYTVLL
ncbi:MAG: hypothetical protein ACC707_20440, partial [Thiohalomonadales bacterium]